MDDTSGATGTSFVQRWHLRCCHVYESAGGIIHRIMKAVTICLTMKSVAYWIDYVAHDLGLVDGDKGANLLA